MTPADLSDALAVHAESLVRKLFPNAQRSGRDGCVGSLAGERGQSLRVTLAGKRRGRWHEFADGTGGDMLDLIAAVRFGGDLGEAIQWAREWLGQAEHRSVTHPEDNAPVKSVRYETLSPFGRALWTSCRPIDPDNVAGQYLLARGCALSHRDGDLRWHTNLQHPSGYVGPALVALVTDARDHERRLTLHRTWISADGNGRKADVQPARLLLAGHPKAGGCVRLWPDDWVSMGLGIAEGIETALTLARGFTPVWSMIDAGNLAAFPVLRGIESLTVAVDHDPAGLKAFDTVAERWHGAGREARKVIAPHPGDDFNDWIQGIDDA